MSGGRWRRGGVAKKQGRAGLPTRCHLSTVNSRPELKRKSGRDEEQGRNQDPQHCQRNVGMPTTSSRMSSNNQIYKLHNPYFITTVILLAVESKITGRLSKSYTRDTSLDTTDIVSKIANLNICCGRFQAALRGFEELRKI